MSLRNNYNFGNSNFDNWFIKKQESDDSAFVYIDSSSEMVAGFLYLKIENKDEIYEDIFPSFGSVNRLKIGTFKVAMTGRIMGERFIKIIFDHAKLNKVEEIYVTIFNDTDEKNALIKLLADFGFELWGEKISTGEKVYVRNLSKKSENPLKNYPRINLEKDVYILPIKSGYHTKLIPDCILENEWKDEYKLNLPWMNAIRKYYIEDNLWGENPNENDIVLFYRMKSEDEAGSAGYRSVISGIGVIVNKTKLNLLNDTQYIEKILKRSVLTYDEFKSFKQPHVLEFLFIDNFEKRPILNFLRDLKIFSWDSGPRGLTKISKENLLSILQEANFKLE